MRLLQVLPSTTLGGAERYALTIGAAAAAKGWEVHMAFPDANVDLQQCLGGRAVRTHGLDIPTNESPLREMSLAMGRTARLLARVRPNVVQLNLPFPTFGGGTLMACRLRHVPAVVVFHGAPDHFEVGRSRRIYQAHLARGQVWVAVSERVRQALARSFDISAQQVTVIRNGVAPATAGPPSREARIHTRRRLGLPDGAFISLSVGRLNAEKGHVDTVSATAATIRRFPHVHAVIAGEGEARGTLEDLIREQDLWSNVHLVGQRNDVDDLMRAADLFVFPSRIEGLPFAPLEAAANGLPVISADFDGVGDLFEHGKSGLIYQAGDTESLRRWIEFAVENPASMRDMGEQARSVANRFSEEEMVTSMLALLEAVSRR